MVKLFRVLNSSSVDLVIGGVGVWVRIPVVTLVSLSKTIHYRHDGRG